MTLYAALIYTATSTGPCPSTPTRPPSTARSAEAAGAVIRGGAALYPTSTATTVRVEAARAATPSTTDGPYAETKEALTGFYLLECADLDEAVAVAATIPGAWDGVVEVRPVIEFPMRGRRRRTAPAPPPRTPAAPCRARARSRAATSSPPSPGWTGNLALAEDAVQDASCARSRPGRATASPTARCLAAHDRPPRRST